MALALDGTCHFLVNPLLIVEFNISENNQLNP